MPKHPFIVLWCVLESIGSTLYFVLAINHVSNYYCLLKNGNSRNLGLIPFAVVCPKWLFGCRQTIHE